MPNLVRDPLYCKSPCSDRVHSSSTVQFGGRDWSPLSLSQFFDRVSVCIYIFRGGMHGSMRYLQDGGRTTGPIQNKQLTHDTLSLSVPLSLSLSTSLPPSYLPLTGPARPHPFRSHPLAPPPSLTLVVTKPVRSVRQYAANLHNK